MGCLYWLWVPATAASYFGLYLVSPEFFNAAQPNPGIPSWAWLAFLAGGFIFWVLFVIGVLIGLAHSDVVGFGGFLGPISLLTITIVCWFEAIFLVGQYPPDGGAYGSVVLLASKAHGVVLAAYVLLFLPVMMLFDSFGGGSGISQPSGTKTMYDKDGNITGYIER
jgi:hypothetical protein